MSEVINDNSKVLVSVCLLTYNHKNYISQCLDSILMQKTDFPFEIILGEDESSDGTREICLKYASKYPDKIRLFLRSRKDVIYINGLVTGRFNFIECLRVAKGRYIALCDGDDYWTDPYKLQKQVEVLKKNPDSVICYHNVEQKDEIAKKTSLFVDANQTDTNTTEDLLRYQNFIPTCSVLFCNQMITSYPPWYFKLKIGDWALHVLNSQFRKIRYINEVMAVRRVHAGGMWSGNHSLGNELAMIEAYEAFALHFSNNKSYLAIIKSEVLKRTRAVRYLYLEKKDKKNAMKYFFRSIKSDYSQLLNIRTYKEFGNLIFH